MPDFAQLPVWFYIMAAVIIILLGFCVNLMRKMNAEPQAEYVSGGAAQGASFAPRTGDSLEIIAVISAAINAVLEEEGENPAAFRIKSVSPVRQNKRAAWGLAGMSHNTKPF